MAVGQVRRFRRCAQWLVVRRRRGCLGIGLARLRRRFTVRTLGQPCRAGAAILETVHSKTPSTSPSYGPLSRAVTSRAIRDYPYLAVPVGAPTLDLTPSMALSVRSMATGTGHARDRDTDLGSYPCCRRHGAARAARFEIERVLEARDAGRLPFARAFPFCRPPAREIEIFMRDDGDDGTDPADASPICPVTA